MNNFTFLLRRVRYVTVEDLHRPGMCCGCRTNVVTEAIKLDDGQITLGSEQTEGETTIRVRHSKMILDVYGPQ